MSTCRGSDDIETQHIPSPTLPYLHLENFDALGNLKNAKKGILTIAIVAEWCGYCKEVIPILNEISSELYNNEEIFICLIDSTSSQLVELIDKKVARVKGFPTIIQYRNGKFKRTFDGSIKYGDSSVDGRTLDNLDEFILGK